MIKVRLKEILGEKNISITQLHELTGISQNTISLLVNGKNKGIQFETLEKLMDALNLDLYQIIERYNYTNHIYVIGVDNDYSTIEENERRDFRFRIMNLSED